VTTPDNPADPHASTNGAPETEAERIVADIEATRADLGETVDALAGKLDVRAQARSQVADARERINRQVATVRDAATDDRGNPTTAAKGVAGGIAAALALLVVRSVVRRRRQNR
jgi:hypothetical protein